MGTALVTTLRTISTGAMLAMVVSGLAVPPAGADDRGILEHQVPIEMIAPDSVFYPARDVGRDYRDYYEVKLVESPETTETMRQIDFVLTDSAGDVVRQERGDWLDLVYYGRVYFGWDGRHEETGNLYPEGTYTITATVVDSSNDRKVMTKSFLLDHARFQHRHWRKTVTAARSVIDRDVGRCGSLRRPAKPAWRGSVGYRSQRCSQRRLSYAATVNGIYLPRDPDWKWDLIRLDIYGGSASGRYRGSQIGYAYLTNEGKWLSGMTQGSRVRLHRGLEQYKRHFLGIEDGEPHFIWSVGVGGGYGYDIKSFTVVAGYTVFE